MSTARPLKMQVSERFLNCIKIVLIENQILGTTTLTTKNQKLKRSKIRCVWNATMIALFPFFVAYSFYRTVFFNKDATLYKTTDVILTTVFSVYVVAVWLKGITNQEQFAKLLTAMIDFDHLLEQFGHTIDYKTQRKNDTIQLLARVALLVFTCTYFLIVRVHLCQEESSFEIMRTTLLLVKSAMCHQTIQLVTIIKTRFSTLNTHLQKLATTDEKDRRKSKQKFLTLCKICDLHHHLIRINKLFNKTFGFLLLLMFGLSFVTTVICFFYMSASVQAASTDWKHGSLALVLSISFIGDMIYVCNVCYRAVEEANLMGELIHKIDSEDHDVIDEVEMFSLQICNGPIEFSAAQFFPIDHTLVFSIIGGVTTYIIILIQLSSTLL